MQCKILQKEIKVSQRAVMSIRKWSEN